MMDQQFNSYAGQQPYQPQPGQPMPMQQPYAAPQADPMQPAWPQNPYPVQGQPPYGYQDPQQMPAQLQEQQS